ncbi:Tm-1-like ATP-binding domain-containing protein [Aestuariivirga litoralis]|uniref:Tm-1-like ATP-binding domain-containing protein n=1 Tax=Aestuariivirga litoralis TaxID=2650924 RepID=UPI0018C65264
MKVYVIGTCDTKGEELRYACACVAEAGAVPVLVDVSTVGEGMADVSAKEVAAFHPQGVSAVLGLKDRGQAISAMAEALTLYLLSRKDIGAVLGLGGGGNTALVTQAMRGLPVGVPKLMLSTMASGQMAPYVGPSDITMMHSVADIAGLNAITRKVIGNAAHAAAGMAMNKVAEAKDKRPGLGFTMFGVTTPLITQLREKLEATHECFVFHATGTGGQCFEKLADGGFFLAVMDMTTTEVADHLFGGVLPCTDDRFGCFARHAIPYIGSVGACDMVNFGARETVPAKFQSRKLHVHNAQVTLMRTTPEENAAIGAFIVQRVNAMQGLVRFLLPLKGVSALDAQGQSFFDPAADRALFDAIRRGWKSDPQHQLIEVDAHINDATFAAASLSAFHDITR